MDRAAFAKFMPLFFEQGMKLCLQKNADYSSAADDTKDAFRNFRLEEVLTGRPAELCVLTRLLDKWSRARTLADGVDYEGQVEGESIFDTAIDGANYFCIFAAIVCEKQDNLERWLNMNLQLQAELEVMNEEEVLALWNCR